MPKEPCSSRHHASSAGSGIAGTIKLTLPSKTVKRHIYRCWKHWLGCMCRQETPHCTSVSFERHAANAFQSYVSGALAFSIKRGGVLYGNIDEEGRAVVEVIYEPEQVLPFQARCSDVDRRQHVLISSINRTFLDL